MPLAETIYTALRRLSPAGATVEHDEGCVIHSPAGQAATSTCDATEAMVRATEAKAARADVLVLCLGEEAYTEKPGDIHELAMHRGQRELSRRLAALGLPTVLVLVQACMYAYMYVCICMHMYIHIERDIQQRRPATGLQPVWGRARNRTVCGSACSRMQ